MTTILITGTATEIGKTWFGARLATALRARGCSVAARKPAQSFEPGTGPTDAEVLADATGEPPTTVCPEHRWYEVPMAPPMAAAVLGRPEPTIADLVAEITPAPAGAVVLVEGAGGPHSPIATDGDSVDLARAVRADAVLLVADAGLGTINAVRLCAGALHGFPLLVALNRFDPAEDLHRRNRDWLLGAGFRVVTDPEAAAKALVPSGSV
ncbi:MAG: ATP-dependent dethiobiotin synthetase BioD [Actinomycetes bacterium]